MAIGDSNFGSRGIGNYIHLDFQNYLKYGVGRTPTTRIGKDKNEVFKFTSTSQGAEEDLIAATRMLRRIVEHKQTNNKNTASILEEYLNGILYSKFDNQKYFKDFSQQTMSAAGNEIFKELNNLLTELQKHGSYSNLKKVVDSNSAKELFLGYLSENEFLKRLETLTDKRTSIWTNKLKEYLNSILETANGLRSGKIQSKNAIDYATKLEGCYNDIMQLWLEMEKDIHFIQGKGGKSDQSQIKIAQQKNIKKTYDYSKGKKMLSILQDAIKIVNSIEGYNKTVYGDIGEVTIAAAFNIITDSANNIVIDSAQKIASSVVGKNKGFNLNNTPSIEFSTFLDTKKLISESGFSNKAWKSKGQYVVANKQTQDTIDINIDIENNAFKLDKQLNTNKIRASIKNYANANYVGTISGAPLLSVLNIGGIDITNHYLNFISANKNKTEEGFINIHNFNNILKMLLAIRSLLGFKNNIVDGGGIGGSGVISNDYLIVNNKTDRKIQVIDTKDFVKKIVYFSPKELGVFYISPIDIDLSNSNKKLPDEKAESSHEFSKQRISKILMAASKVKLDAHVNVKSYRL